MNRILLSMAPSVVILAVCSWLVHMEGSANRRHFDEDTRAQLVQRLVPGEPAAAPEPPDSVVAEATDEKPAPEIVERPQIQPDKPIVTAKVSEQPPHSIESLKPFEIAREQPSGPTPDRADPVPQKTARRSILGDIPSPPAGPVPAPGPRGAADPIAGKDPMALSRDGEANLGAAVHELILRNHDVSAEGGFRNHLFQLVLPLLERREPGNPDPKLFIIQSDEPFAFSHVGGYIYVSRVLELMVPHEVELQFLLAHEIAHLDKKHAIKKLAREMAAEIPGPGSPGPGLAQRVYHQIAAGYDPEQEAEADAWACQQLMRLHYSPHEILGLLRRLATREVNLQNTERLKPPSAPEAQIQDVEHHWRRHPPIPYRVGKLDRVLGIGRDSQGR
jgi:hypothetical protein